MANHLIHRQVLKLSYNNVAQAKADMNSWGERFQEIIQPAMAEVLDELALPNQTIRIDLLELDLGKIPSNLDADLLIQRVKDVLKTQILKEIPQLAKADPKSTNADLAGIKGTRDELQELELLLFLLEHGRNPWWKSTYDNSGIRDSLQKLLQEKNAGLKSFLGKKPFSATQLQRLQNHSPYSDLWTLVQWVFPSEGKNWKTFITSLEMALPENVTFNSTWKHAKSRLLVEFFFAQKPQKSLSLSNWTEEFLTPSQNLKIPIHKIAEPLIWSLRVETSLAFSTTLLENTWEKWVHSPFIQTHSEFDKSKSPKAISRQFEVFKKEIQNLKNQKENPHTTNLSKDSRSSQNDLNMDETYPILNAGLVLTAPFLPYFFIGLGLVENKKFVSNTAQNRAALLIQALLNEQDTFEESELLLNKILCGIDPGEVIPVEIEFSEEEKEEIFNLLNSMVTRWTALKSTSAKSMAQGFFPREGSLKKTVRGYELKIPRLSLDVLLNRLPWTISIIKLPWMQETLFVEW
jgi:hypothetical protein